MLDDERQAETGQIGYAAAHRVIRLSTKRYELSPYLERYYEQNIIFGLYAERFYPLSLGRDPLADYWQLRRGVMLYDVPEKPLEISGPDALTLLERVFCRRISTLRPGRARYAIACTPQGTIFMDGVLIRLAENHFYYVQANGPFESWLLAHCVGLDITVRDPRAWVLQIQGPKSLEVLAAATTGNGAANLGYFHAGRCDFAGQSLLVSRTGWTGELGFEVYSEPTTDHLALWDHLIAAGAPFGLRDGGLESMGIRRIEAGILDNGTDLDKTMTPYEAGLGAFVDLDKPDFVGRSALLTAPRQRRLFGLVTATGRPSAGLKVMANDREVGSITAGGWSPTLGQGIGYVRFHGPPPRGAVWLNQSVTVRDEAGQDHNSQVVDLPFFDQEKRLPRGRAGDKA